MSKFTVNEAAFRQMQADGVAESGVPYLFDELWYPETPAEFAYMRALPGSMEHPDGICSCPPEGYFERRGND